MLEFTIDLGKFVLYGIPIVFIIKGIINMAKDWWEAMPERIERLIKFALIFVGIVLVESVGDLEAAYPLFAVWAPRVALGLTGSLIFAGYTPAVGQVARYVVGLVAKKYKA